MHLHDGRASVAAGILAIRGERRGIITDQAEVNNFRQLFVDYIPSVTAFVLSDSQRIDRARLLDSAQVTDSYLLALAATHGGQLTTFDRHLVADAVVKGSQTLHVIA